MKFIIKTGILITCLFLASCAQFKLISTQEMQVRGFSVTPATQWSLSSFRPGKNTEIWTIDGYSLNQMLVFGNIGKGDTLLSDVSKELPMPKFRPDMLPNELEDFVKSSINNQSEGKLKITSKNVRPQDLAGQIAFRFELEFFTEDGLQKSSDVIVWVKEEKLYGMIFTAPTLHYYEALKSSINQTYSSIKA